MIRDKITENDCWAKIETLQDLEDFSTSCGYDNAVHFLNITGVSLESIRNKWFQVVGHRVFLEKGGLIGD